MPTGRRRGPFQPFRCRGPREGKPPPKTPESSAPRPYIGYVSSQWHTRQPQAPPQLAATSWCRSHAYRTTERAVLMPRSTEGKTPPKTPESSAPRPYIGYVSSQWHTRQPQALEQLAAISWCRSHAYRTTERAVSMPRSTEGKNTQKRGTLARTLSFALLNAHWSPPKTPKTSARTRPRSTLTRWPPPTSSLRPLPSPRPRR